MALLATSLLAANASATCPTDTGVAGVRVAYIDLNSDGTPDVNSSDKERNEHARISQSLATQLGIDVDENDDVFPQLRVITEIVNGQSPNLEGGYPGTGIFSIFEVYPGGTDEIQVWADEDSSDDESGEYRLFEDTVVSDLSAVRVTVHGQAPSETTVTRDDIGVKTEHYCEPHSASTLTEAAVIEDDKRFALLVPHGGKIEFRTSDQIGTITQALEGWGVDANTWDLQGIWHDDDDESEHWHITSSEVSDEQGFPGLTELATEPNFDASRDFQYVASLHGMKFDDDHELEGLVIGGRANREAKCLIASRVRERMAAEGKDLPAVFIWNWDDVLANSIEVAHTGGVKITDERGSDPGLSGLDPDNVVNRLSPNADGSHGYGGFQIEQSPALRADGYRELVAQEIAHAFGELLTKPDLVQPGTAICDALEDGLPAPTAEIRGRAFWDGGEGTQDPGEGGVAGLAVELLDASSSVVAQTTTGADGTYAFPALAAGTYRVRIDASSVLDFAAKDQANGDDTLDSDVDSSGTTGDLVLTAHELTAHVDAGVKLAPGTASVGDFVWADAGTTAHVQDAGDEALGDVLVELFDDRGVLLASDLTDGGLYGFAGLPAGEYVVRFTPPAGYEAATFQQGGDTALDSDIQETAEGHFEAAATLSTGETKLGLDAGFLLNCQNATLVAFGSEWTWSASFDADWKEIDFPESGWNEEKQASLGYGTAVETTIPDSGSVTYFRLAFELEDPTLFDALDVDMTFGDGAIVYLNEQQVYSHNVPVSGTGLTTDDFTIAQPGLVEGTNVLAVEVHETGGALAFDLELSASICRPCVETRRLSANRVTYLRQDSTSNRGDREYAKMDADATESALFAFPAEELPQDAEVLHAALEWRVTDKSDNVFHLYPLLLEWDEATADFLHASDPADIDWNTPEARHETLDHERAEPLATFLFDDNPPFSNPPYTGLVVLNVSGRELVQAWARGERDNHGVFVPGEGPDGDKLVVDSNDGPQPPVLEVIYRSCSQ